MTKKPAPPQPPVPQQPNPALEHTRDYYTVSEAAARTNVCEQRIRSLLGQGRIYGAKKHGRAWMIPIPFVILKPEKRKRGLDKIGKT